MNATGTLTERPPRRSGLVGPAILVTLGAVLLLNNLGYLGWGVWETLAHLWPVLLISIGLDLMIGRRSILGSALVALLVLLAFGMAIWWTGLWLPPGMAVTSETISQPLGAAQRADIDIAMGAGRLNVGALSESDNLIEGMIAKGSGVSVTELNNLLNRFNQMQQMFKKMGKFQKMMARGGMMPKGFRF